MLTLPLNTIDTLPVSPVTRFSPCWILFNNVTDAGSVAVRDCQLAIPESDVIFPLSESLGAFVSENFDVNARAGIGFLSELLVSLCCVRKKIANIPKNKKNI